MARALTILLAVLILASAFEWNVPVPRVDAPGGEPCDGVLVPVAPSNSWVCIKPGSGESFKDCPDCPEMVVVPAGSFLMGSPASEPERREDEGPQHDVRIGRPFAVGKYAVTFAEWDACVANGGCGRYRPDDGVWKGLGRNDHPVINVNWDDANAYLKWLSQKTGQAYRLPTEAEREYVTRAGTATPFWWGAAISPADANYHGDFAYAGGSKGENRQKTMPVDSFKPNPWGLYQVHGNVWDWVEDCYHESYQGAPVDGAAWTDGDCQTRVLRGGSWTGLPRYLRAAYRQGYYPNTRWSDIGFRVARTIVP
jgi:formylglycine-generating enzyme required for sulfatase activity